MPPKLYPILDAEALARAEIDLLTAARALRDAGLGWVQYRDKQGSDAAVVAAMQQLRTVFPAGEWVLLLNDRVALCDAASADGVHVGQDDMAAAHARELLGPSRILGVSTHNVAQLETAAATGAADYLAIGPVFPTQSKVNPDPVIGLEGVAAARSRTDLPLVAIGGINRGNARAVIEAGADGIAVISSLLPGPCEDMRKAARDFLQLLR